MAHFAEIDEYNIVTRVLVFNNNYTSSDCTALLGGNWIQTSYNNNIRKNFASIGYTYDKTKDAFIAPKPYPSWTLVEDTCQWTAPVTYPDDGKHYSWDEDTTSWKEIT